MCEYEVAVEAKATDFDNEISCGAILNRVGNERIEEYERRAC